MIFVYVYTMEHNTRTLFFFNGVSIHDNTLLDYCLHIFKYLSIQWNRTFCIRHDDEYLL